MWNHDYFEKTLCGNGYQLIAGVDEVGRGALAGPVVAAAVMFDGRGDYQDIRDSKTLAPARREQLAQKINREAIAVGWAAVSEDLIDRINILRATHKAMLQAIANLKIPPDMVLVDGFLLPGLDKPCMGIIHGDSNSYSIAAASIVAKVCRDSFMIKLATEFPHYGFDRNKGYGTDYHLKAITERGPSSCHRRTFGRVREMVNNGGINGE